MIKATDTSPTQIQQLRARAAATGWKEKRNGDGSHGVTFERWLTTIGVNQSSTGRVVKVKRISGAWDGPVDREEPTKDKFQTAMRWLEAEPLVQEQTTETDPRIEQLAMSAGGHLMNRDADADLTYTVSEPLEIPGDAYVDDIATLVVNGVSYGERWIMGVISRHQRPDDAEMIGEIEIETGAATRRPDLMLAVARRWIGESCAAAGLTLVHFEDLNHHYGPDEGPFFSSGQFFIDRRPATSKEATS